MKHLIVCREFPPAPYAPGGIGTYVAHISRALAERGETVHVIGQRWEGADKETEISCNGRLIVHRISADDVTHYPSLGTSALAARAEVEGMLASSFPAQWFSWVAAGLSERLIEREGIDIVEGQEWEAPLFFLLMRRALGLGPDRKPPCVVHFHSPTESIFQYNDWSIARPDYLPMKRYEDYVIRSADAYLCPSNYLSAQCSSHYGIPIENFYIQPYPLGSTERISRDPRIWTEGSICYFGRLEPRKGVVEWVDAAVAVAQQRPTPVFEFIGSDLPFIDDISVKTFVKGRIPQSLQEKFVFHDAKPRHELLKMLGGARIAAVPSRWENFPNTCIEAMCTGLPVLASREGGMVEMVEDGHTGWLPSPSNAPLADQLAEALHRALDTPPERLAGMGDAAAISIRQTCNNDVIARRHIEIRQEIVERGAKASLTFSSSYPWPERPVRPRGIRQGTKPHHKGIAVGVLALRGASPANTLASLASQTVPPSTIAIVSDGGSKLDSGNSSLRFVEYHGMSSAVARRLAIDAVQDDTPLGWLFLNAGETLDREALEMFEAALQRCQNLGAIGGWFRSQESDRLKFSHAAPPAFPYQWLGDELAGPVGFRTEALVEAGIRSEVENGQDGWDLANAVMAAGWAAVHLPALIGTRVGSSETNPGLVRRARQKVLERFPELLGLDAPAVVKILEAFSERKIAKGDHVPAREEISSVGSILRRPLREQATIAFIAMKRPIRTSHWLLWRGKNIVKRKILTARDALVGSRI